MTTYNIKGLTKPLTLNKLTQTQFNNATVIEDDELHMVDPEFTGNYILQTTTDGDMVESSLTPSDVTGNLVTLEATDSITLADNTTYTGGTQTALTIVLPSSPVLNFVAAVHFSSGSTVPTLSFPNSVNWMGDDLIYDSVLQKKIFDPVANKRYTLMFYNDGVSINCVVRGV